MLENVRILQSRRDRSGRGGLLKKGGARGPEKKKGSSRTLYPTAALIVGRLVNTRHTEDGVKMQGPRLKVQQTEAVFFGLRGGGRGCVHANGSLVA